MKKFFTILACAALLGGFAGCSDKDDLSFDPALLTGRWKLVERYWSDSDGDGHETVPAKEAFEREFRADGTGSDIHGTYGTETFSFRIDGYLFLDYGGDVSAYEIEALTDTQLVLGQSGEDEDGEWSESELFVRISQ